MPDPVYRNFFGSSGGVKIEVEGTDGGSSGQYSRAFLDAVSAIADSVVERVNEIPQEKRPSDMEVSFGLKALNSGGFAISLDDASANFKVSMKWGGGNSATGLPNFDIL